MISYHNYKIIFSAYQGLKKFTTLFKIKSIGG